MLPLARPGALDGVCVEIVAGQSVTPLRAEAGVLRRRHSRLHLLLCRPPQ